MTPQAPNMALDVPPGVVTGENLLKLLDHAKTNGYAIPSVDVRAVTKRRAAFLLRAAGRARAPEHLSETLWRISSPAQVNVSSTSTANAVLEAAKKANAPVMIQVSQGGGAFLCGKGIEDPKGELPASAAGSVALALHVRAVAAYYGVPVVMHSDHCAKKLLPWFDKMLEADEAYERPARDSKAAPPRLRCGTSRGTAAATAWIVRGGESLHRRGRDVDSPWRRVAATPRPRRG